MKDPIQQVINYRKQKKYFSDVERKEIRFNLLKEIQNKIELLSNSVDELNNL